MTDYKKYEPFFNAWYITRKIGSGSFGDVFEVERKEFGKVYKSALKIISIPKDEDEKKSMKEEVPDEASLTAYYDSAVKSISDEVAIMSEVKGHSNIVSYEDHEVIKHEDGIGYDIIIRMELLTLLMDYQKAHHMKEQDVIKLGVDLCNALDVCAMKNIIHRDIKPGNIFVSDTGDYKLGDFGIARTIEATTSELSKKGTYTYMAPEVYVGRSYDSRADIYSLGLVMYTLLNKNRLPFYPLPPEPITYTSKENAIRRRLGGEALPYPASCSKRLGDIILKACAYNPNNRFRSAAEFRTALLALSGSQENDFDKTVLSGDIMNGSLPPNMTGAPGQPQGQAPFVTAVQGIQSGELNYPQVQYTAPGTAGVGQIVNDYRKLIIIGCIAIALLLVAAIVITSFNKGTDNKSRIVTAGTVTKESDKFSSGDVKVLNSAINFAQVSQLKNSDNMKNKEWKPEKDGIDVLIYVRNDNDEALSRMDFRIDPNQGGEHFTNLDKKGKKDKEVFTAYGLVEGHSSDFLYANIKTDNKWANPKTLKEEDRPNVLIKPDRFFPAAEGGRKITLQQTRPNDGLKFSRNGKSEYYKVRFNNTTEDSVMYDHKGVKLHKGERYVVMLKGMANQHSFNSRWGAGELTEAVDPYEPYKDDKALYNPQIDWKKGFNKSKSAYVIVFDKHYLKTKSVK